MAIRPPLLRVLVLALAPALGSCALVYSEHGYLPMPAGRPEPPVRVERIPADVSFRGLAIPGALPRYVVEEGGARLDVHVHPGWMSWQLAGLVVPVIPMFSGVSRGPSPRVRVGVELSRAERPLSLRPGTWSLDPYGPEGPRPPLSWGIGRADPARQSEAGENGGDPGTVVELAPGERMWVEFACEVDVVPQMDLCLPAGDAGSFPERDVRLRYRVGKAMFLVVGF